jgi:heme/copper-type cytochrome/quinol oxidase subunit 2
LIDLKLRMAGEIASACILNAVIIRSCACKYLRLYTSYPMKKQASSSISIFVQRALIITFIIALIEIPVVYFYASYKTKPKDSPTNSSAIEQQQTASNNEAEMQPTIAGTPVTTIPTDTVAQSIQQQPTTTKPIDTIPKAVVIKKIDTVAKTIKKPDTTTIAKAPAGQQILTSDKMAQILDALNATRLNANVTGKCVKIRKASNSNVTNAFAIADYLKSKGFIISGREDVSKQQQGFGVVVSGDCMIVTIGAYK